MNYRGGCLDRFCRLSVYSTNIYYVARNPYIPAIWCAIQRVPILLGKWSAICGIPIQGTPIVPGKWGDQVPIMVIWGPGSPFSWKSGDLCSHFPSNMHGAGPPF